MPNTYTIPIFTGSPIAERMRDEFVRYQCRENQLPVNHNALPDVCQRHIFSISAIMHRMALGQ